MSDINEKLLARIQKLEREVERLRVQENGKFVALTTPLTSTSWDGDAYSTTAKTKIDLSTVFGVPAGVKAVLINIGIRDLNSLIGDPYIVLSPNSTSLSGFMHRIKGLPNDYPYYHQVVVPCNSDGDIYYQIAATGTDTMDVWLEIWGWWL